MALIVISGMADDARPESPSKPQSANSDCNNVSIDEKSGKKATNSKAKTEERPPTMAPHSPREFQFARKTLRRMVLHSDFFPSRAMMAGWFRPHDLTSPPDNNSDEHERAQCSDEWRRPSASENSIATASTAASSGCSPVSRRRATVDGVAPLDALVNSLGLPLDPLSDAVDTSSGRPIEGHPMAAPSTLGGPEPKPSIDLHAERSLGRSRRASLDNGHIGSWAYPAKRTPSPHSTASACNQTQTPNPDSVPAPPVPSTAMERQRIKEEQLAAALTDANLSVAGRASEWAPVPSVHERDVDYGRILGKGGFCEVRLAGLKVDAKNAAAKRGYAPHRYAMKYLSPTKLTPPPSKDGKKASRNKQFERGVADLAIEARFLALLSHTNIIKLHYVSEGELEEQYNCAGGSSYRHQFGYFLMLDPLYETLASRIDNVYVPQMFEGASETPPPSSAGGGSARSSSWLKRMMVHKRQSSNSGINTVPLDAWRAQLAQRLGGLKDIASAMAYLHDLHCVYRDLKPDNIGFYRDPHARCRCGTGSDRIDAREARGCTCYREIPKLFDFGLAKELKPRHLRDHPHHTRDNRENTYKLTARSGSRRYMSPEVFFSTPYNDKADVYSFGIVLYQVASLVTPFDGYSLYRHEEEVLSCGDRPCVQIPNAKYAAVKIRKSGVATHAKWMAEEDLDKRQKLLSLRTRCVWSKGLKRLIQECWHDDMRCRPKMKEVVARLEGIVEELTKSQPGTTGSNAVATTCTRSSASGGFRKSIGQTEWSAEESDA